MTDSVVVEGYARVRDGKKWRTRWLVLRKPSPVADCLVLQAFKDKSDKVQRNPERSATTLEEICGLELGQWNEGVAFTLAVVCLTQTTLLGFESKDSLLAWEARLRYSLGEVHRFSVGVLPGTKLESGPATLHMCNSLLALARDSPPVVVAHWNLPDLRRYGPVPNGFVFEGGTRCGYWAGVFLLASAQSEQISFLLDCVVRGISPTRGPFGLRPVFPEPGASGTGPEERLRHETLELEKRLSTLSQRSGTAPRCPSAGGDDRSISGSSDTSDTSQSDCSVGSRLAVWTESTPNQLDDAGPAGAEAPSQSAEKRLPSAPGGGSRPLSKPPRQLEETGRQRSSDSGIACGSQSSSAGSWSSYAGSLDGNPGEDFGSALSLPPPSGQDLSLCTCLNASGREYRVPASLRYLYHAPRKARPEVGGALRDGEAPAASGPSSGAAEDDETSAEGVHTQPADGVCEEEHLQSPSEKNPPKAPPGGHPGSCGSKTMVTVCSACGRLKGTLRTPASTSAPPPVPDLSGGEEGGRADPAYELMDGRPPGRSSEAGEKYELMGGCGRQRFLQEREGRVSLFPPGGPHLERPPADGGATYVNIPVSPASKKQLNYMELQEPGSGARPSPPSSENKSSTKYAQIDITATEMAHRAGLQHALGRQEGLHTLELRRKAPPP